jgi:hypothetical protein
MHAICQNSHFLFFFIYLFIFIKFNLNAFIEI